MPLFTEEAEPTSAIAAAAVGGDKTTHSLRTVTSLADARATIAEIRSGHAEGSANILLGYMRRHGAGVKQIKKLGSEGAAEPKRRACAPSHSLTQS